MEIINSSFCYNLYNNLKDYCSIATRDRDPSHGVEHMNKVCLNSIKIWENEGKQEELNNERILSLIITVAILHDIADHKYGKTIEQIEGIRNELHKYFNNEDVNLIMSIIENISYSKEAKMRQSGIIPNWEELGIEGSLVRNIVSDADKIEAIGIIGVQRCLQYSYEVAHSKNLPIDPLSLYNRLIEHGHEKLFILKDQYIRTNFGRFLAEEKHNEMMNEIEKLTSMKDLDNFNEVIMKYIEV